MKSLEDLWMGVRFCSLATNVQKYVLLVSLFFKKNTKKHRRLWGLAFDIRNGVGGCGVSPSNHSSIQLHCGLAGTSSQRRKPQSHPQYFETS
jgi:hypothetical protein